MDDAFSWAVLHPDLIRLIGWRVLAGDLIDYVRFRAVCPLWRSSTVCPRGRGLVDERFHPRRWVLLPEGRALFPGHSELHGYVRFFNTSTGLSVRARLPLFEEHRVLDSVDGLVLLLQERERDGAFRLLHPFTGDIAELPTLTTLVTDFAAKSKQSSSIWDLSDFRKICATSVSVSSDGLITVMILLSMVCRVAFATTSGSDRRWCVSSWSLSPTWSTERSLSVSGRALPTIVGDTIVKIKPKEIHLGEYHLKGGAWLPTTDESSCGFEPSPNNLIHRIFWCHYNWERKGTSFQGETTPRLVRRNWRDEV